MRPIRCSIRIGFQGRSKFTSTRQNWRFRPSPPASVLNRIRREPRKSSTARSFSATLRLPWKMAGSTPSRRSRSARYSCVRRNCVKTRIFSSFSSCFTSPASPSAFVLSWTSWAIRASLFRRRRNGVPEKTRRLRSRVLAAAQALEPISFCRTSRRKCQRGKSFGSLSSATSRIRSATPS